MKKILSLLLALIMCLTVLTSCDVQGTIEQVKGTVTGVVEQIKDKIDSIINPEEPVEYHIDKAESFLKNMYKDVNPVTGADYEVVGQVRVAGVAYTVTWESNSEQVVIVALENGNYLVDLNEKATEDVPYVLTATITAGNGDTATVTYNRTIPQYNVLSWDAYMAAQKGDVVLVEGIVVEMNAKSLGNSRNHLFLMDASGKGGYYVYQMDQDPAEAGVKIGMTVSVSGPIEPYSGMQEIKGGTFTIVDETIKEVAPIDITDLVVAGTVNYGEYVALPVTIKGVTIGSQDMTKDSSQYLYFTLPDAKGTQAYVRTYVTDFPTTLSKAPTAENADKAAIDKLHADHFGYTADVTGILILYSGNPYLIPMSVDCFTNFSYVEKTAEEKVDAELGELALETTVTSSTVVDILTVGKYYEDVTISWTSDSEYAVIEGNKLTLTVPTTGATAKVTATVTCGDVTKTKEFTIKLSMEPTALADIITLALSGEHNVYTTDKYIVAGVITEVYNTTYGNMKITDEFGNILTIYGTYGADGALRYDALESKPVAGDYVVVLGVVGHYNGTAQVKNGWILTFTTPTSIEDANAIGAAKEHNTYTEEKHLITGVVTEVANTKYGNLYIEDEAGNKIYVYGCYDQAGNRYDAMVEAGHAPVVGDTITVLSIVGQYNGTVQLKNATVVVRVAGATEEPAHECEHVCETCQKCTDAACEESVCAEKCEGHETTEEPEVSNTVELTVNSLGLADQSYSAGTATVGGVAFEFVQLGNYGDGIQMRDKDGKTSILWNTSAFGSAIVRIDLVYSGTKDVTHSNPDAVIFSFGTAVDNLTYSTKLSTTAGTKTYTITPDAESYTFFKLEHDLGYSMYWESITFVLADGTTVNPNPNPNPDPVHTCESKCEECGKCTDAACTESVCAEKCEGHTVVVPSGVVDPVVGTAYAFGMVQGNVGKTYYLKGGMNGYYMDTTENIAEALHVYIEETTGGYYLYCYVGTTKTYINCVVSGTHVNGAYEATASTVYTYDAESKTLIADVDGTDYWFGTRNDKTYTTVGPCAVSYEGFYCQFYAVEGTETPGEPVVPTHECESECDECGKCTDAACTESVCADKCAGHEETPVVPGDSYTKATSVAVGDKIVIVYEAVKAELSGVNSNNIGTYVNYTDAPTGAYVITLEAGTKEGTFAMKTPDGKYLYATNANKLSAKEGTVDDSMSWTITFDSEGNAIITNVGLTDRVLQWNINANQERFCCYKNTMKSVQIYK